MVRSVSPSISVILLNRNFRLSRNFRFGFQQPHTILEFLFLKREAPIKPSLAAACLSRIAHFGSKLLRNPDLPLAQPATPTPLHRFASSRTDLFDHQALVTLLAAAAPQSVSPCSQRAAASDGSPPTVANNNVHASPAVHPSSPAVAVNWSATSSRFACTLTVGRQWVRKRPPQRNQLRKRHSSLGRGLFEVLCLVGGRMEPPGLEPSLDRKSVV